MKKLSRKILSVLLVIAMLVPTGSLMVQTSAETENIEIGDKITLGTYNGSPINWICVDIDENGPLMLAEDVLCQKEFDAAGNNSIYHSDGWGYIRKERGSNNWQDSNIRQWLNSTGTVDYTHCPPSYKDESGFMSNFTSDELRFVKPTYHNVNIVKYDSGRTGYCDGGSSDSCNITSSNFVVTEKYYKNLEDSFMLLDGEQFNNIFKLNSQYLKASTNYFLSCSYGNNYACFELCTIATTTGGVYGAETWACETNGIRPAFYLNVDAWETEKLSDDAKAYIQQHVDFVNSNTYNNLMTNASFYNALWQYESTDRNFTAYTAWEVLGDVGEIASLNFNNLFVTDNPYDVILADVLSGYVVDNTIVNICEKTLEVVFDVDKIANSIIKTLDITDTTTLKDTTEAIKSYLSESKKKFIDGVFFSTEEYDFEKKHPGAYETLSSLFPKVKDDKWDDIFGKLKNTSTIIGYINTGSDVVGCFFDAYQKYLIAQTLVESQSEVLGALMVAGYYLPPIAQDLFVEALTDYLDVIDYDSSFSAVCNYALGGSIKNVYNILKEGLKTTVYSGIAKMLGVAAGNVNAVVFTYNTTYSLLDYFSGLGEGAVLFFLLDSAAMLEDALLTVVQSNANNLKNDSTLEKAKLFDASWSTLQAVEQYTYNGLSKYISSIKKQNTFMFAIKTTVGGFFAKYLAMKELNKKNSDADTAIQVAVMFEGEWKNSNCHDKNSQVSKVVSVKCPTDVYVYDEAEKLMLSIVNNKIEVCDIYIAVTVDGNEKIFALPDTGKYNIKIVGTDDGTMDYGICDLLNNEITEYTEFEDISLSKDCVYTGVLDDSETDYDLTLDYWVCKHPDDNHDGICDSCSEDFTKGCSCNCHSNAFMQFIHKILCFLYRIFGMEQYRYCGCGKAHW